MAGAERLRGAQAWAPDDGLAWLAWAKYGLGDSVRLNITQALTCGRTYE